jgi:uncharacterized protein (TIGR00375 family)
MNIREIAKYAKIKGLGLVGTGDFSHPLWFSELRNHLKPTADGIYECGGMRFLLSNEISLIYTQDGRTRKVHNIILAPNFDVAAEITEWLKRKGRVDYDGRPIFNLNCPEFVEGLMDIDKKIEIIPAHIWTPHFGALGASSGFNSVEECFGDQHKHIHALETGLSSDPAMNWRISSLDRYSLVSFSDSHSAWPWRLGREATVFDLKELSFNNVIDALRTNNIKETVEFFPEAGKYHLDGHRDCRTRLEPRESVKIKNICPVCRRKLTIGVLHRVEELADRPEGFIPKGAIPFKRLLPLTEIISTALGIEQLYSKKIWEIYDKLVGAFGSEFDVLLSADNVAMEKVTSPQIAELILSVREGKIQISPGYDGVYGKLLLKGKAAAESTNPQSSLMSFIKATD